MEPTNPDTATGKEGDVEARCFRMSKFLQSTFTMYFLTLSSERDSPRDQLVVTLFLIVVFGLLLGAAIKSRMGMVNWNSGNRRWWEVSNCKCLLCCLFNINRFQRFYCLQGNKKIPTVWAHVLMVPERVLMVMSILIRKKLQVVNSLVQPLTRDAYPYSQNISIYLCAPYYSNNVSSSWRLWCR